MFRHDINGLRAIAVISVVIFHFYPKALPGGFVGVDVFFVISGFLMTKIIFTKLDKEEFNLMNFYGARLNRIVPPLLVLTIFMFLFAWFNLIPMDFRYLAKQTLFSSTFLSNFLFLGESGYFTASSKEKWLLHTWSLSVEWQFYILYPLLAIFCFKFLSVSKTKAFLFVLFLCSAALSSYISIEKPQLSYFSLLSRSWEMLFGALAFIFPVRFLSERINYLSYLVGLLLIVVSLFTFDESYTWPFPWALIPTVGTYLVICSCQNKSRLLYNYIFDVLGKWSYSIYLWHWPIVVYLFVNSMPQYLFLGMVVSIVLGGLSYHYVEKVQFSNINEFFDFTRSVPIYGTGLVVSISIFIIANNGLESPLRAISQTDKANFVKEYVTLSQNLDDAYFLKCNSYFNLTEKNYLGIDESCVSPSSTKGKSIFLWGDSHAEALSYGIRSSLSSLDGYDGFYQVTSSSCKPSLYAEELKGDFKLACDYSNKLAIREIEKLKPNLVILAQAKFHSLTDWDELSFKLKSLGVERVLIVGPVPQWKPSLPRVIIKPFNWDNDSLFISDPGLNQSMLIEDEMMMDVKLPSFTYYESLISDLCYKDYDETYCRTSISEKSNLLQVDYGHLSPDGSKFVVHNYLNKYFM